MRYALRYSVVGIKVSDKLLTWIGIIATTRARVQYKKNNKIVFTRNCFTQCIFKRCPNSSKSKWKHLHSASTFLKIFISSSWKKVFSVFETWNIMSAPDVIPIVKASIYSSCVEKSCNGSFFENVWSSSSIHAVNDIKFDNEFNVNFGIVRCF